MLDPANIPEVDPQESLTRYILSRRHFRRISQTVKPDAFVPPSNGKMSVTRLLDVTDDEIWAIGREVAIARDPPKNLYGRSDVLTSTFLGQELRVIASPLPENANHADVANWPMNDKAKQKLIAQEVARVASFVPSPSENET